MISLNMPWSLLNRMDHHCHEKGLPSRTQFLIEAAEEALERANYPGAADQDED